MCVWVSMLTPFGDLTWSFVSFSVGLLVFQLSDPQRPLAMGVTLSELSLQVTRTHTLTVSVSPKNTECAVFCRQLMRTGSRAS